MEFLKPKKSNVTEVNLQLSERTKAILDGYTDYSGHTNADIVMHLVEQLVKDPTFKTWVVNKKKSSRLIQELYPEEYKPEEKPKRKKGVIHHAKDEADRKTE